MEKYMRKRSSKEAALSMNRKSTTSTTYEIGHAPISTWERIRPIQFKKESQCDTVQFVSDLDLDMNGARPAAPSSEKWNTNSNGVNLERDHIIPYDTIRDYVKLLSYIRNRGKNTSATAWIKTAFTTAERDKRFAPRNNNNGQQARVVEICQNAEKLILNEQIPAVEIINAKTYITSAVAWMLGNIVMGPNPRSDDNHEGFDAPLVKIADKNIAYEKAYTKMVDIINALGGFQNMTEKEQIKELNARSSDINFINYTLTQIANKQNPYPYVESQWIKVHGKYKVK